MDNYFVLFLKIFAFLESYFSDVDSGITDISSLNGGLNYTIFKGEFSVATLDNGRGFNFLSNIIDQNNQSYEDFASNFT